MTDEEDLEWFREHEFHKALDDTSKDIDPSQGRKVFQGGPVDTAVSTFVLFWRALQQAWPIAILVLAVIGWRQPIRTFLQTLLDIEISTGVAMIIAILGLGLLTALGYLLFFRWGSQQKKFLANQKMNVAQALDYRFKKAVAHSLKGREKREKKFDERLEKIDERLGRLEREVEA